MPVDRHYYDALASRARGQYNHEYAVGYRRSDDLGVDGPTHTDFGDLLTETCLSFGHSISVLDLACGTGRYFHHLRNVQRLIGIDISLDMLMQARHPVREEVLQVRPKLICSNLADFECPDATFDLIYAIGVLGEFMPFDAFLCQKVASMLRPAGKFVFTVVDRSSPSQTTWKRTVARLSLFVMPKWVRTLVKVRLRELAMREEDVAAITARFFTHHKIWRRAPFGSTARMHWVTIATKNK